MGIVTIKKNPEFRHVFARGRSRASRYVVLYHLASEETGRRFGFVVSRKVGHAVERNRLRRMLKEITRLNEGAFKPGFDYVIVVRPAAFGVDYSRLEQSLLRLARDLG
ncbi:MAG: ribonuclease P protein component [Desulforudis sp.]|jgi:ribonuclease P protein component|nr:ribonuclease P protein component [Clostridia bacterium]MDQ7792221.1 ribonuclease P protein component [Clostridia bacterium]RJX21527.1 MAG: ribonuclease P protein component [Desulforudis sp.]